MCVVTTGTTYQASAGVLVFLAQYRQWFEGLLELCVIIVYLFSWQCLATYRLQLSITSQCK